ncbi:MAG: hypothetical protein AUK47_24840 [Deltaproteobacteria bacterium CG2_30_63_29]|nr:MAG: hypothetical protein AUK47_24840 [Deltaproteobacteria bacterium CG2_30_63_29]PJB46993.1 MAG: hypothetical protein CO108_04725 [Deltaproteobacteria bacterium CG_4_9_14_3_um_filter_63_12]
MRTLAQNLAELLADALAQRAEVGQDVLRALHGRQPEDVRVGEAVRALLTAHNAEEPVDDGLLPLATPHHLANGGLEPLVRLEVAKLVVLGDVHGHWEAVEPTLQAAGLIDERGAWCAPPGTALVQVGDVLDAGLRNRYPAAEDPRGDSLWETYGETVRSVLSELAVDIDPLGLDAVDDEPLRAARHRVVGACCVVYALRQLERLSREALEAGGQVVMLLGNHEVDLLSGRFWWYGDQKRTLLELTGLSLDSPQTWPSWLRPLASLPMILRVGPLVLMHGGPTREVSEALEAGGVDGLEALLPWLEARYTRPFDDGVFAEGGSIVSPSRDRHDFVGQDAMLRPWLQACAGQWLVVGHSPFLGFLAEEWPDPTVPEVERRLSVIERVGPGAQILKVDTNLKRSARCEVLAVDFVMGSLEAVSVDGRRDLLRPGESLAEPLGGLRTLRAAAELLTWLDQVRGPSLADLSDQGLDALEVQRIYALLEGVGARFPTLPSRVHGLLRAFPASGEGLLRSLRRVELGDEQARASVERLATLIDARVGEAAHRVRDLADPVLRLFLDGRDALLEGVRYRLLKRVVEAIHTEDQRLNRQREILAVELSAHEGRPCLLLSYFEAQSDEPTFETRAPIPAAESTSWATLVLFAQTQLAELGNAQLDAIRRAAAASRPGPRKQRSSFDAVGREPLRMTPQLRQAIKLLQRSKTEYVRRTRAQIDALIDTNLEVFAGDFDVGREQIRPVEANAVFFDSGALIPIAGPWPRLNVLATATRLYWVDTTFVAPGGRFYGIERSTGEAFEQAPSLVDAVFRGDAVVLHAQLKRPVVQRLIAGEVQELVLGERYGRTPWCSGCYLFTSPEPLAAADFADHNPVPVRFELTKARFLALFSSGLLQVNLMSSDGGKAIDASGRWGTPRVALEVVGIGAQGVTELWASRVGVIQNR